jgi:DHA1 family multidrug resistance protein-like MFS transporter
MPLVDLFRDTSCGQILRLISRGKLLQYPEERDPELWKKYIHEEKSANFAKYGQVGRPDSDDDSQSNGNSDERDDPEKGKDKTIITFLENDPEVHYLSL